MPVQPPPPDATTRFSNRVDDYVRYRPSYPPVVLECLIREHGLQPAYVVADVGSGTGILSELLLRNGNPVLGVEPNREMRSAAERLLAGYPRFRRVDGRAEATSLPAASVDWVTAGQAFHWFDPAMARAEFARILRPNEAQPAPPHRAETADARGATPAPRAAHDNWRVALVWNSRRDDTPFLREYLAATRDISGDATRHRHEAWETDGTFAAFFAGGWIKHNFANRQVLDLAGLCGRTLSNSNTPRPGEPRHAELMGRLKDLFERHQVGGEVALEYNTHLYVGGLG